MNRRKFLETTIIGASGAISSVPGRLQASDPLESRDGYIRHEADRWIIGNSKVEKVVTLKDGRLLLTSFRNKYSGREYVHGGAPSQEVRLSIDGQVITGASQGWVLKGEDSHRLPQGELQLDLKLENGPVGVSKHYVVYPGSPVIREWMTITNISSQAVTLSDPGFLESRVLSADVENLDLYYMTGGCTSYSVQLLKKEKMSAAYARTFDSYDPSDTGPRGMSYSAHLPLLVLHDWYTRDGIMAGWDYLGHWTFKVGKFDGDPVNLSLQLAGYKKELNPGESIETPKAFIGVFSGDLDAMGNLLLDWQYEYLWDLTNPDYFAKTRWAVDWPSPWVGDGGTPSADNWGRRLALDLRYVDLLRETGGDILWDDAGWYDKWGSWNSPEWRLANEYLAKHSMKWVLWFPTFLATPDSEVGQQHPEWLIAKQDAMEQSIKGTADWQRQLLDKSVAAWGDFQWRYDIAPAVSATDTAYLDSDQNFRGLLEGFKRAHPSSAVDACFGGGRWISYDIARLAESGEYTDGGVGPYSGYYTSLLAPPDKYHNVSDFDHTYYNPASDRVHLCMDPCWYRDPGDGPDLEAIRRDWEIYHYLVAQGVAGRWSHVFRPAVENDDPIWYFQRMDRTNSKGVIITKHAKLGPTYYLVCKPKERSASDTYYGGSWDMSKVATTEVARADTGIYEELVDHEYRFYGGPGDVYGPLNFKYTANGETKSYVTSIERLGKQQKTSEKFFGMAIQIGTNPITMTHLGQYALRNAEGAYTLMVVRANDGAVLGSVDLDTSKGNVDAMGFKYAALSTPLRLDPSAESVVVKPRGLKPEAAYDVRCTRSNYTATRSGRDLMQVGIEFTQLEPGELIFLNLPNYPGSGSDRTPPTPPLHATKRLGTNLGVQGVEVKWEPGSDNNWVSFYEVLKNGAVVAKVAKGTFFFDYKDNPRQSLEARYEVRTVDGDGNRSSSVLAELIAGDPETYTALGGFSPTQGAGQWKYEEAVEGAGFAEMRWDSGGYEGRWTGSGMATIGRIWMQPGAASDVSRTFVCPAADAAITVTGSIRKDLSAQNGHTIKARILHNDRQIWPATGWAEVLPEFEKSIEYRVENVPVAKGDSVRFVLQHSGRIAQDAVIWNPSVMVNRRTY